MVCCFLTIEHQLCNLCVSKADGSSLDVHINMGRVGPPQQSESQNRIQQALQMLSAATDTLNRLEVGCSVHQLNRNYLKMLKA